jgi:predicted nucleic acid-binding protein
VIIVDTSVWIDFFAGRDNQPHVRELLRLIDDDAGIAITDIILTEILQGLRDEQSVERVEQHFEAIDVLRLNALDDFRSAAALYRQARRQGVTIRKTLDCLIAAVCIREGCPILHNDRDFDQLASTTALTVYPAVA